MSCPHLAQDVGQLLDLELARPLEVLGGEGELDLSGLLAQVRGQLQRVDLARAVAHWGTRYTLPRVCHVLLISTNYDGVCGVERHVIESAPPLGHDTLHTDCHVSRVTCHDVMWSPAWTQMGLYRSHVMSNTCTFPSSVTTAKVVLE